MAVFPFSCPTPQRVVEQRPLPSLTDRACREDRPPLRVPRVDRRKRRALVEPIVTERVMALVIPIQL